MQRLRHAEKELLANVSHELRTPLARIRVVLELAAGGDTAQSRRYLTEISSDLTELEQLLDGVIASARLDLVQNTSGDPYPPLKRDDVDVEEVAEAAAARFRERWPERELAFVRAGEPLAVTGDRALLRRVIDNLLDNARKYSTASIELAIARSGERAKIEVIDRGIGIAAEDLPHLFTSFFRADRSRSRHTGGIGLGLSLSRRIVEAHGGAIEITSELGRGTRAWFVLPLTSRSGKVTPTSTSG
jgi:signal transduction histidine kinase